MTSTPRILLFVVLALAPVWYACAARVADREPAARRPTPWCFRLELRRNEAWQLAEACAEHAATCQHAADQARRWGGVAQLRAVGACRRSD